MPPRKVFGNYFHKACLSLWLGNVQANNAVELAVDLNLHTLVNVFRIDREYAAFEL